MSKYGIRTFRKGLKEDDGIEKESELVEIDITSKLTRVIHRFFVSSPNSSGVYYDDRIDVESTIVAILYLEDTGLYGGTVRVYDGRIEWDFRNLDGYEFMDRELVVISNG